MLMMKPRIRPYYENTWSCTGEGGDNTIGYGFSPEEAYNEYIYWRDVWRGLETMNQHLEKASKITPWQRFKHWLSTWI